ncbi:unnamed protein product, partial [Mesorhabditis spiculigera]
MPRLLLTFPQLLATFALFNGVASIPRRGVEPWSLMLCKFNDTDFEPRTAGWFREWLIGAENPGNIENYFATVSNGIYTISGSNVTEWVKMPWTRAGVLRAASLDPSLQTPQERPFALYDKAKELCIQHIWESRQLGAHRQKITVINREQTAIYGRKNGVLLTPNLIFSSVLAHEMVHSMNIGHSYSDRLVQVFPYASIGEYDDKYDLMSTANAHMRPSTYGLAGPGLNGPHLDYLGWLPMNRVVYFGRDGRQNYTLRLSSLSLPHKKTNGWLLILNVYTVEFRTPDGHDKGIGQPGVLIHRIQRDGPHYYSQLITHAEHEFNEMTQGTEWVKFLQVEEAGGFQHLRIRVDRINRRANFADVKVISTFRPNICLAGEQTKKLSPEDPLNKKKLPHVCIFPNRSVYPKDLERQEGRAKFFERRKSYGQNACIDGYEWRAIDAYDYVCVMSERARQVQVKTSTELLDGDCNNGTVTRSAFPGDSLCVDVEEKWRIDAENAENLQHLKNPQFFNGADSLN